MVLLLLGTTELELDRNLKQGFGKLTDVGRIGVIDHAHLAVIPEGQYLSLTGCDLWSCPL